MFIVERPTAGVLAALVIPAVVAILSDIWDRVGGPVVQPSPVATSAIATLCVPEVRPIACAPVRINRDEEVMRKHAELGGIPITRIVEVPQVIDPLTANN